MLYEFPFTDRREAEEYIERLKEQGIEKAVEKISACEVKRQRLINYLTRELQDYSI